MRRVLLIVPTATYRAGAFLAAAGRLGIEVVTASERPQALAGVMGANFLELDLDDPIAASATIVEHGRRHALDAVIAVDDQGGLIAALAAGQLGLRGNRPAAVAATRNKVLMRTVLGEHGVSQPPWRAVAGDPLDPEGEVRALGAAAAAIGFPVVLKPSSLSASRGVIRADGAGELAAIARRVRSIASQAGVEGDEALIVERFVSGAEFAVEGLVERGELTVLAVFDKPDRLEGPYFEETIYVTPSRYPPATLDALHRLTREAVGALGIVEGPVHAEIRVPDDGGAPVLVEVAARTIGGRCSGALEFAGGASLEELVLRQALGDAITDPVVRGARGVMMIPIPGSGTLEGVDGVEAAAAVPGVTGVEIAIAPGRRVHALPEGDRYLGFIFAAGETPGNVEDALRGAHRRLTIHLG